MQTPMRTVDAGHYATLDACTPEVDYCCSTNTRRHDFADTLYYTGVPFVNRGGTHETHATAAERSRSSVIAANGITEIASNRCTGELRNTARVAPSSRYTHYEPRTSPISPEPYIVRSEKRGVTRRMT